MKKILNITVLAFFCIGLGLSFSLSGEAQAGVELKQAPAQTLLAKKRCEKCKRGKDGKMVCEEVECPE